jgi:hypothetical protein
MGALIIAFSSMNFYDAAPVCGWALSALPFDLPSSRTRTLRKMQIPSNLNHTFNGGFQRVTWEFDSSDPSETFINSTQAFVHIIESTGPIDDLVLRIITGFDFQNRQLYDKIDVRYAVPCPQQFVGYFSGVVAHPVGRGRKYPDLRKMKFWGRRAQNRPNGWRRRAAANASGLHVSSISPNHQYFDIYRVKLIPPTKLF